MNAPASRKRGLLLEALETRTLLAADDPFGLIADFDLTMKAVSGEGEIAASFPKPFGHQRLLLTGNSEGTLIIDLNKLPDFVVDLEISSVSEVLFIGTDSLRNLILKDVDFVSASDLSVREAVHATNVDSLSIAFAGDTTVLKGTKMALNAKSVDGHFGIFSDLEELTLTTDSKVLLFTSLSSEQTLYLTKLPDLIATSGLDSSSIRFGLPPVVDPGPGTNPPEEPGANPNNPGSGDPIGEGGPGDPQDPGQIVIITLPADERTRAFIAELREILRTRSGDPQQFVLEFLNRTNPAPASSVNAMLADSPAASGRIDSNSLFSDSTELTGSSGPRGNGAALESAYVAYEFGIDQPLVSGSSNIVANKLPDDMFAAPVIDIDVFWPVAPLPPSSGNSARPSGESAEEAPAEQPTLEESLHAFGSYLVERVSAEFFPGQQSLVLLVDPKPTRSSIFPPNSALDEFANGGRRVANVV